MRDLQYRVRYRYPLGTLPILTMIATIIDPPATVLNVVGDSASSMLVARLVDGKDWLKDNKKRAKTFAICTKMWHNIII